MGLFFSMTETSTQLSADAPRGKYVQAFIYTSDSNPTFFGNLVVVVKVSDCDCGTQGTVGINIQDLLCTGK